MTHAERARAMTIVIPLMAAVMSAAPGCGGDSSSDFDRAKSGGHLKTPSEVRQEAEAKYGKPEKPAPAGPSKPAPQ